MTADITVISRYQAERDKAVSTRGLQAPLRETRDTRQVITDQEITQGCYPKDFIKYIFIS